MSSGEIDTSSWVEIKVTSYFTIVSVVIFLSIFEIGRRSSRFRNVYDAKRVSPSDESTNVANNRMPPPLIRNRVLEWLFLSTDPEYWTYSQMKYIDSVIKERRRQRELSKKIKHKHKLQDSCSDDDDDDKVHELEEGVLSRESNDGKDGILYDSNASSFNFSESSTTLVSSSTASRHDSENDSEGLKGNNKENYNKTLYLTPSTTTPRFAKSAHALTPDVYMSETDGRRLPMYIAEYAISGDLTNRQLRYYETKLLEKEVDDEKEFNKMIALGIGQKKPCRLSYVCVRQRNARLTSLWDKFITFSCCCNTSTRSNSVKNIDKNQILSTRSYTMSTSDDRGSNDDNESEMPTSRHINNIMLRITSGRSMLSSESSYDSIGTGSTETRQRHSSSNGGGILVNRHLRATSIINKRPLGIADLKLLRCIGLDAYVMIRFLRYGFDVTFYPFLIACAMLIPTYYSSDYIGGENDEEMATGGYFQYTINKIEPGSMSLWIPFGYAVLFYIFCLRKLWVEWETFMTLRFDFLANGDATTSTGSSTNKLDTRSRSQRSKNKKKVMQKDDIQLHLEQYRNSCLVEYIPESHRRDKELYEFFDAILPGQVKRAEILLNASRLTNLIKERQQYIESYENTYAKHFHERQLYKRRNGQNVRIQPKEPTIEIRRRRFIFCGRRKLIKALPHYLSEIKRLNNEIEEEHNRIVIEKNKAEDSELRSNLLSVGLEQGMKLVRGTTSDLTTSVGFVEFTSLTAKQQSVQCNITGTNNFMVTTSAPDPRDLIWENITVEHSLIKLKRLQVDVMLGTAALFWSVVVTFITSISNLDKLENILPSWLIPEEDTFVYGLIQGYLPVLALEIFMLFIPIILKMIAKNFIHYKTNSEIDKFVFLWHFVFRLANLLIIILSGSLYGMITDIRSDPSDVMNRLVSNIAQSSQFFLNNMIVAAGSETLWELAQIPKLFMSYIIHQFITVQAKSKRSLQQLEKTETFDYGQVIPPFIFGLLVGVVYCTTVPIVLGVCSAFFYMATKVYIHQALFVYTQHYEGGGKFWYLLSRTIFIILYISIVIFSTVLGLREAPILGTSFLAIMMVITIYVDLRVTYLFVNPSLTLALTNARIIDEKNRIKADRNKRYQEYKMAKLAKLRGAKEEVTENEVAPAQPLQSPHSCNNENSSNKQYKKKITFDESTTKISSLEPASTSSTSRRNRNSSSDDASSDAMLRDKNSSPFSNKNTANSTKRSNDNVEDFYLYRQPMLNKALWETKPRSYR